MQDSLRAVLLAAHPEDLYSSKSLADIFGVDASDIGREEIPN